MSPWVRPKHGSHVLRVVGLALLAMGSFSQFVRVKAEDHPGMIDKNTCTASKGTFYIEYKDGPECLAYYVVGRVPSDGRAIIFVGGDMVWGERLKQIEMFQAFASQMSSAVRAFRDEDVPIVILGRPGLFGSSGDHQNRHRPREYGLIGQAIEQLVRRFKLTRVALVGASGGSSAIMGALSSGTNEGNCIIAGSGAYEIAEIAARKYENQGKPVSREQKREWDNHFFSHHRALSGMAREALRRVFLIGDSTDLFAPFAQQVRYAETLQRAGHRVRLVEAKSKGGDGHSFVDESLRAAARCLKGDNDERVVRVIGGIDRTP